MRTFSAALTALLLGASLTLAPTAGWTQTSAPPAPDTQKAPEAPKATDQPSGTTSEQPSGSASGSATGSVTVPPTAQDMPATPAPEPAKPGTTAQDRPSTTTPADRADDGTFLGMSRTAAIVLGLVILGIIVALVAMSRRDRDVVETRTERDVRVYDRERDVYDDRERPRKVS